MAHIDLPKGIPGIRGPMTAFPYVRQPITDLANAVMCGPSSLTRGERELIATFVSSRNECRFCMNSHASAAHCLLGGEASLIDQVIGDLDASPVSDRMRALLNIAEKVRRDGRLVSADDIGIARDAGADDQAIHDTVLITAMFCMFNRYVDGLATPLPGDDSAYQVSGARVAAHGYVGLIQKPPIES